jgi:hypothetical protein
VVGGAGCDCGVTKMPRVITTRAVMISMLMIVTVLLLSSSTALGRGQKNYYPTPSYPSVFLFGAPKCGTTALYTVLMSHKLICNPGAKEPSFFGFPAFFKGHEHYYSFFNFSHIPNRAKRNCVITLDATPYFSYREFAISDIQKSYHPDDLNQKKFIIILRDPAKRLFSWYNMVVRLYAKFCVEWLKELKVQTLRDKVGLTYKGYQLSKKCGPTMKNWGCRDIAENSIFVTHPEKMFRSFEEFYEKQQLRSLQALTYQAQLVKLWKTVPRKNTFILNFEVLVNNTAAVMTNLSTFLGIQDEWGTLDMHSSEYVAKHTFILVSLLNRCCYHRTSGHRNMDCLLYDKLTAFYERENKQLLSIINDNPWKPSTQPYFPPFSDNEREGCTNSL